MLNSQMSLHPIYCPTLGARCVQVGGRIKLSIGETHRWRRHRRRRSGRNNRRRITATASRRDTAKVDACQPSTGPAPICPFVRRQTMPAQLSVEMIWRSRNLSFPVKLVSKQPLSQCRSFRASLDSRWIYIVHEKIRNINNLMNVNNYTAQNKQLWFCRPLRHSVRKRGGLILQQTFSPILIAFCHSGNRTSCVSQVAWCYLL